MKSVHSVVKSSDDRSSVLDIISMMSSSIPLISGPNLIYTVNLIRGIYNI